MDPRAQEVLDFWFAGVIAPRPEWFKKNDAFDREIERRFAALIEDAVAGRIDDWSQAAASALARIVVLDQFTRNTRRGRGDSFAGDERALSAAQRMVERSQDLELAPLQRVFVYLPFEHSEDIADQQESLRLFDTLMNEDASLGEQYHYARLHFDVIQRFGRFPHRNEMLGRESTDEEVEFLTQPGSRF